MKKQKRNKTPALRRMAEKRLAEKPLRPAKMSKNDTASLIHELQVHQIELEMQNEQLRQAQTIIENSNKRFSDLYDFAPVGHLTVEKEGKIIEANLTAAQLLGVTTNSLINKPFNVFVHPSDKDVFFLHLRRLRKSISETCEIRLVKKGSAFFHAQLFSAPLANRATSATEFLITVLDVSARKLAEEKAAQHYAILEAVMESSDGPIFSVDRDYRYLCFNSHHAKTMKILYNANIKVRHSLLDYHSNLENRRTAKTNIDKAFGGKIVDVETYAGDETGTRRYFKISHNPVRGPGGEVTGVAVFAQDLTDRKRMEDEIRQNEVRLEGLLKLSQYSAVSIQKLLDFALDEAIILTGSKIGYIYYYDEVKKQFTLNTWSKEVMKECTIAEQETVYQLEKTGIWGEAVRQKRPIIINDFHAPDPLKKGYPEGHAQLHKFMTIPVLTGGKIVGVVGVANKDSDYNASDVRQLTLLMDSAWRIAELKKAEETRAHLSAIVENSFDAIFSKTLDGIIESWNASAEKMYGYTEQEIKGKPVSILV
ncbi:MAG: PAS domain S-box protein, partial [Chitinivibrionales bacterium]